jgi:hypothetical protein
MESLSKLSNVFREFGMLAGALYLADRALMACTPAARLFAYELIVQPVPPSAPSPPARVSLSVREIHEGDPALAEMPVGPAVIAARFAQRARCLGVFKGEVLAGYMWFCDGRYEEDEVRCTYELEPRAQSVFDYDFYVFPEHRMGRAFATLWAGANRLLSERGIRYTYSRVSRFNTASRRAHRHLGARCIGDAVFLRLGRLELMVATLRPFVRVSLRRRASLALNPASADA